MQQLTASLNRYQAVGAEITSKKNNHHITASMNLQSRGKTELGLSPSVGYRHCHSKTLLFTSHGLQDQGQSPELAFMESG